MAKNKLLSGVVFVIGFLAVPIIVISVLLCIFFRPFYTDPRAIKPNTKNPEQLLYILKEANLDKFTTVKEVVSGFQNRNTIKLYCLKIDSLHSNCFFSGGNLWKNGPSLDTNEIKGVSFFLSKESPLNNFYRTNKIYWLPDENILKKSNCLFLFNKLSFLEEPKFLNIIVFIYNPDNSLLYFFYRCDAHPLTEFNQ